MKKIKLLLLALTAPLAMFAQQGVNYQAVVRDGGGVIIANQAVSVEFSIRETNATGNVVYAETHNPSTNDYGLINVVIGQGTVVSGVFANINWGGDLHFLDITIDGNNLGAIEFQAVPYAIHAKQANQAIQAESIPNVTPNTVNGDVDMTSGDSHAVVNIYPTANPSNDSSTVFFGEGSSMNNGMALTYDGTINELRISGELNGTYTGPHMKMDRATGSTSFTKGVEVSETTTAPAKNTTYGNSGPLAYGYFTTPTNVVTDYGITSVTNPSTGIYTVVLDNSWSGFPVVTATSFNASSDTEIVTYSTTGSNTINVKIVDENNAPINSNFSLVVYGVAL